MSQGRGVRFGFMGILAAGILASTPAGAANGDEVILQGFHWFSAGYSDPPNNISDWYGRVQSEVGDIAAAGFDYVYLPPMSVSGDGHGYHPKHWYDLYSVYGGPTSLSNLLGALEGAGVKSIADVVVNHRVGTNAWCDFTDPWLGNNSIASDDESFAGGNCGSADQGNWDSGWGYDGARDLDHHNHNVRNEIKYFLSFLRNDVRGTGQGGFDGFRYDYAKGYAGSYLSEYNNHVTPTFSVAEYWFTLYDLEPTTIEGHRNELKTRIEQANFTTQVFDFTLKGVLNTALPDQEYWRLNQGGESPGLNGTDYRSFAVTFAINHDTDASDPYCSAGQMLWPLDCAFQMQANAYLLLSPGTPMISMVHFSDWGPAARDTISQLIAVRKGMGLHSNSDVTIHVADSSEYAHTVDGVVALRLGGGSWTPGSGWSMVLQDSVGAPWEFTVWTKDVTSPTSTFDQVYLRGTFNGWGTTPMTLVANDTWELGVTFGTGTNERFKFDRFGDWSENYGDSNGDGWADLGGADIPISGGAGDYTIQFNDATKAFTVTKVTTSCVPTNTCGGANECGIIDDGCGAALDCGGCMQGEACVEHSCECQPLDAATACVGNECGSVSDGCGGTIDCGTCAAGSTCSAGTCQCVPDSGVCDGACGIQDDGCGGSFDCGSCVSGATIDFNCDTKRPHDSNSTVYVVGNDALLGSWSPANGLAMIHQGGSLYSASVGVSASASYEWKCVIQANDGSFTDWEPGGNNLVTAPSSGTTASWGWWP